jgi:DNA-binding transcriptional regulator LsrR (DeoR family)
MEDGDRQRLLAKVARLYHHSGLRQVEIADRLRISQTRVSRLLQQAEACGIVKTVVVPLIGLHSEIEEELEARYSLAEVHVVDAVADDEVELGAELGAAAAAIFASMPVDVPVVGVTSWRRTPRHMIDA